MTRRSVSFLGTLLVCLWTFPAFGQESAPTGQPVTDAPAHISVVDGTALLERDGRTDTELLSMPLLAGDRVRTQAGRVEILFADGSALHLDEQTMVDFQSDEVVRLLSGRVRLSVSGPARDVGYRIDAPSAWVQINNPGEYRVSLLRGDEVELAVLRGGAELVNEQGRSYVSAGERTYARLQAAPSPAYVFNSAAWDSFDRWSESRRDQRLGVSAQYLPEDVRQYAPAFDTYGSWRHEPAYGYVWSPRVQVGWRPYYRGRWVSLRPYGWTWIANDPWGWPTHHYGRWGISGGTWFWIPGRSWAPAWVSWGYAPGYVSWCPLGWNNRPVLGFSVSYYGGRRYDPWYAWSVLPRGHFSSPYVHVSRYPAVRVDPRLHGSFVVNHRGPDVHFAVNRSGVPIRTAGRPPAWRGEAYHSSGDSGDARISAATAGGRDGERRLAAGVRVPGSSITNAPPARAAIRSRDDGRSLAREGTVRSGSAGPSTVTTDSSRARMRAGVAPAASDGSARGFRRGDGSEARTVTEAPAGAVRAVPRVRGADGGSNSASPQQLRSYSTAPREAPAASAPPVLQQRYSAPEAPYRSPQNRAIVRGSDGGNGPPEPGPRGGGGERNGGSYQPRSFGGGAERQAPAPAPRTLGGGERQAPSAAAPAPRGDDGGPRGGSGRPRSGDGGGTGQAVGRRR